MLRRTFQIVFTMGLWVAALLIGAGRLDWTRGWISVLVYGGSMGIVGLVVNRRNPGMIDARSKLSRKGTKQFDKFFVAAREDARPPCASAVRQPCRSEARPRYFGCRSDPWLSPCEVEGEGPREPHV